MAAVANFSSCADPAGVDLLVRSASNLSSDSMQTATPSSANGSILEMAEGRDDSQQQAGSRASDGFPRKRCRDVTEEQTSCSYACDGEPVGKRRGAAPPPQSQMAAFLRGLMRRWAQKLYGLQPKCKVDTLLAENAIAIFDAYVKAVHERMNNGILPVRLSLEQLAAACFWIAIKADGSRACLPSRALLERACEVRAALLSSTELEVLIALDWEVFGVLRRAGFHCTVRPAEEGPELRF